MREKRNSFSEARTGIECLFVILTTYFCML
jgi:hypothetical protein